MIRHDLFFLTLSLFSFPLSEIKDNAKSKKQVWCQKKEGGGCKSREFIDWIFKDCNFQCIVLYLPFNLFYYKLIGVDFI